MAFTALPLSGSASVGSAAVKVALLIVMRETVILAVIHGLVPDAEGTTGNNQHRAVLVYRNKSVSKI